jgi:hypothetical protein
VRCRLLIGLFKFKFDRLNINLTFLPFEAQKVLKNFKTRHLFYVMYFKFLYNYFLKFIVHEINFEIVKSGMVVLTERKKTDVTDADVAMGCIP